MRFLVMMTVSIVATMFFNGRAKRARADKLLPTDDAVARVLKTDGWIFCRWLGWRALSVLGGFFAVWGFLLMVTELAMH